MILPRPTIRDFTWGEIAPGGPPVDVVLAPRLRSTGGIEFFAGSNTATNKWPGSPCHLPPPGIAIRFDSGYTCRDGQYCDTVGNAVDH